MLTGPSPFPCQNGEPVQSLDWMAPNEYLRRGLPYSIPYPLNPYKGLTVLLATRYDPLVA